MGLMARVKQIGGALVIVLAVVALSRADKNGPQPFRVDHTKVWTYVKTPHRPASIWERRLGEVASFVARRPVEVRCEDFSEGNLVEPGGVVQFNAARPADFARLRPDVCTDLVHFARAPGGAYACASAAACDLHFLRSAQALTVLAHESVHLRGLRDEAIVQCYAMQAVPAVARTLGAPIEDSRALAAIEYSVGYPRMPSAYRSAACRQGGSLDLSHGDEWLH
jgi:hypothetical protein